MATALNALSADKVEGKRSRRPQQNFMAFHNYITEAQWNALLDNQTPSDVTLTAMLSHAMRLGLRSPTEPSLKWLVSLAMVVSRSPSRPRSCSLQYRTR